MTIDREASGRERSDPLSCRMQDVRNHANGCRFPVGPCDTDDDQFSCGKSLDQCSNESFSPMPQEAEGVAGREVGAEDSQHVRSEPITCIVYLSLCV